MSTPTLAPCPTCGEVAPPGVRLCPRDQTPLAKLLDDHTNPFARDEDLLPFDGEPTHVKILNPFATDATELAAFQVEPGTVIGEYVAEAKIGEGSMGEIWRGRQPLIAKQVAIKILRRKVAESPEAVARFIQEARAVNTIRHRNLVDVFSFGDLPDRR